VSKPTVVNFINEEGERFDPTDLTVDDWWAMVREARSQRDASDRKLHEVCSEFGRYLRNRSPLAAERERSRKLVERLTLTLRDYGHSEGCLGGSKCECWKSELRSALFEFEETNDK
jgi:hypothetical protein